MKKSVIFQIKTGLLYLSVIILIGCSSILDRAFKDTVDSETGSIQLEGLAQQTVIRRDDLGIPVIEADNFNDLAFATGYVMASDRLAQMIAFNLMGQGRLSEMAGPLTLDIDILVRALGVDQAARNDFEQLNGDLRKGLEAFSKGVNAYIQTHKDRLPFDLALSKYFPEPWAPVNSLYIAHALNLGLSFNMTEEIAFLNLAKAIGPHKAAWLFPVYPDEPLPFDAADALSGLDFKDMGGASEKLSALFQQIDGLIMPLGIPASNNWGISPFQTQRKSSIIANDTHLPLEMPPIWMMLHMKSKEYDGAGIAIAGVPCIIAGYNGHIAWGETMVMGDTEDIFIEQLKTIDGKQFYLDKGKWAPVKDRQEVFKINGQKDEIRTISYTRHGPLLNSILANKPINVGLPQQIDIPCGLAVQTVFSESDQSFNSMFDLTRATNMEEARRAISGVRFMALNFIYGNKDHVAWQVSGRYPKRNAGRGHLPVPGWTGEYDWDGYVNVNDHPYILDPDSGFLGTANNRTLGPENGLILSSTWYSPERAERIMEMLKQSNQHTWQDCVAMQNDRYDRFVKKLQQVLFKSALSDDIQKEIAALKDDQAIAHANDTVGILKNFDGVMAPDSMGAAVFGIFQQVFFEDVFLDELGPENSMAWVNFKSIGEGIYDADQDHMLGRDDSPFWDNLGTPEKETKAQTMAKALADTIPRAEKLLGTNRDQWKWGRLLNYQWRTQITQMKPFLSFWKRLAVSMISGYTDRGPYFAGGDFNTLNVAAFHKGEDFDVWLIPAMRMVVDFGLDEPMFLTNSGGQSGNPSSIHYDDGISVWLDGTPRPMPFKDENIQKQYSRAYVLVPKN